MALVTGRYDTDKGEAFLSSYRKYFSNMRDKSMNILEIGVHQGGSLSMWRDYFASSHIYGVDINSPIDLGERISVFQGSQDDPRVFDNIRRSVGISGFDIIIDDASHLGDLTWRSFQILYQEYLSPGGIYVIEDWGTGYWPTWPDGERYDKWRPSSGAKGIKFASHSSGMVGFVKALVDCVGCNDIAKGGSEVASLPGALSVEFFPGQVFVRKP